MTLVPERHTLPDKANKLNLSARSGGKTEEEKRGDDPLSLLLLASTTPPPHKSEEMAGGGGAAGDPPTSTSSSRARAAVVITSSQFQRRIAESILQHDEPQLERLFQLYSTLHSSSITTSTNPRRRAPSPIVLQGKRVVLVDDMTQQPAIPIRFKGTSLIRASEQFQPSLMDYVCDTETGFTLMHLAVLSGEKEMVRRCLYSDLPSSIGGFCCPHRVEDGRGETALTLAMRQAPSCVRMLFDYSVEADRRMDAFAARIREKEMRTPHSTAMAVLSAEESMPCGATSSVVGPTTTPSSLLAPITNVWQRHVLGHRSTNLPDEKRPGGKTREANIPGRHRQLQPLGSMPSASALSPPRSPSPLNPNRRENITTTPAAPAAAVRGLSSGAETTASESGSNGLDQRSGGIYRTTHLMRHTLLHCAVSADAFSPPWPERLAFIQMLVRDYGMRASQENAFGCTPAMWAKENAAYLGGGVKGTAEGRAEVRRIIRFLKTAAEKEEALERSDPKRWLLRQAGVRISPSRSPCRAGGFGDAEEEEEEEAGEDYGKNYNNNHHYNPGLSPHIGRPFRYGEAEKEKGETNNDRVEGGAVGRRVFEPDEDEPEPQCPAHAFATTTTTPPPPAASCAKKRVGFCSPPPVAPLDEKRSSCCTSPSSSSSQTAGGERREQQKGQHHPSHKTRKQAPPNSTAPLHYNSAAAAAPADLYHRGSTCVGVFSASPSPRGPSLRSCGTCPPSPVQTSRKSEERGGGGHSKYAAALATATRIQSRRQGSYIDPDGHSRPREVSPSLRMALSYLEHGSEVREPSMLPHEEMNELLEHQNGNQSRAGATTHQNRKRNKNNGTWNRKEEEDPLVQKSPTTAVKVVALPLLRMSLVTTPAQKIRWYLQGPTARLVMFAVLFLLHLVHNAMDISGSVQHVWRAELWGTVWNMLFSSWLLMTFFMGLIRVGLLIVFGIVLGYHVFPWLVGHWIGVRWLRLPLLGAQSIEEKNFERVAFGLFFSTFYDASQRYKILLRPIGVVGGVYIAAKVYNLCICLGYPEHYRVWATIPDTFYSGSLNTSSPWFYQSAWLTFWGLTFLLDVFAFVFAMDLMHQQGALNVYLPDYRYDQFANWIDGTVYPWLQTWPRCAPGLLLFPARLHITHPWKRWSSLAREVWHAISRRRHTETVASSGSSAQEKNRKRRDAFTSDGGVPSDHFHLRRSVSMMSFRVWWFWAVTTVLLCLLCFPLFLAAGLVRHRYTYGQIQPVSPAMLTLSTGTVVQGWCCVAVASTAVLCLVVVSLQEWHWPSHTVNASLSYPGGLLPRTYAHPSLLFLVLLMGIGTLDLRAVVQNSRVLVLYAPHRGGAIVALILALLPALLGVLILLTATFSTSLRVLQRVLQREAAASQVECDATQTDGSSGGCCARLTRRWRTFRTRSYEVWKLWAMGKHLFALPVPAVFGVLRSLAPELPSWTLLEEQEETTVWWSSQHPTPPLRDGDDCTGVHQAASERAQSFWVAAAALATHQAPVSGGPSCNPHSLRSSGTAGGAAYLAPLFDPMADLTARQDAVYRLAVTELVDVLEAQQLLQRIAAHWVLTEQQQDDNDNDEDEDEDETEESRLERLEDVEEGEMLTAIANATTPQSSRIRPAVARAEEEEEEETSATTTSLSLSTAVCRRVMFTLRRRQRLAFWKKQQSRLRLLTYLGHAVPSSNVAPSAYPASRVAPAGRSSAAPDGLIMVDPKERHKQQLLYESKREAYKQQMWNNRARQRQYQHQRRSPSTKRRSPSARRVAAR